MADPFSMVHDAVVAKIRAQSEIVHALGDVNRKVFSFAESEVGALDTVSQADLPEIQVLAGTGTEANLSFTSCSAQYQQMFEIQLNTGSVNVKSRLNPIMFGLLRAMMKLQYDGTLDALQWLGHRFVSEIRIESISAILADGFEARSIKGWTSIHQVIVTMHFTRTDLLGA